MPAPFPAVNAGVAWMDCDNDGRLDLFIMAGQLLIFHNDGNGHFTDITADWPPIPSGNIAFADVDNDGRMAFLLSSYTGSNYVVRLYRNHCLATNTPPASPSGLAATVAGRGVTLSWAPATDANQSGSLSYNLRVGSAPGKGNVVSPMADLNTGRLRVPRLGNVQEDLHWRLTNLPPATYYWSVQAVDNSFAGSAFAPEMSFVLNNLPVADPQLVMLPEDSTQAITLTGSDPKGLALTFTVLTQPIHGTLTGTPPNLVYQPVTNYFGADSFTFRVNNGLTNSAPAQVALAVTQVPDVAGASLSLRRTNNQFTLSLVGEPYDHYRIEASQDLVHWVVVTNLLPTNGPLPFVDPDAGLYPRRFYRSALQLTPPQVSSPSWLANGPFQFSFTADVGRYYQLLASTNLKTWVVLTNLAAPASNVIFLDPAAHSYPRRFYQARPLP